MKKSRNISVKTTIVLFSGPPGVGKSTLSYKLTKKLGWGIITKDQIEASLKKNKVDNDWQHMT